MNINSPKSVPASPKQGKANRDRETRKDRYRAKFGNYPHMIIPREDSAFIRTQSRSTMVLWHECWEQDPYGNRWVPLNHSLKSTSFWEAKKILSERGLFVFKRDCSIRDGRETVCWLVLNLHGARRNDYWLKSADPQSATANGQSATANGQSAPANGKFAPANSISIETQTQQALQNPSGGVSGSSSVTPQGDTEEPGVKSEEGDRHRQPPQRQKTGVGSAPPQEEKKKAATSSLVKKSQNEESCENPDPIKDSPALTKKSTLESTEKPIRYDPYSDEAFNITTDDFSRIDAEKKTETHQSIAKDAFARGKANLAKRNLDLEVGTGRKQLQMIEEELKREKEAERLRQIPHGTQMALF